MLLWEVSGFGSSSVLFVVLMLEACHQTSFTEVVSVAHCKSPASQCHLAPANYRVLWAVSGGSMSGGFYCEERMKRWSTVCLMGYREVMGPLSQMIRAHGNVVTFLVTCFYTSDLILSDILSCFLCS